MGNIHPRLFGARLVLAVGGVLLVLVVVQVSGQCPTAAPGTQCRVTDKDCNIYDATTDPPLPDGLSFMTNEVTCGSPAGICRQSSIEDCDKVACNVPGGSIGTQVCLQAKISNVQNLDCLSDAACWYAEVTVQDGGYVKCGARSACGPATFEAVDDAKFTLECVEDQSCDGASVFGASDIDCLTVGACFQAKFFFIPQDGSVECSGDSACFDARMGVDDIDIGVTDGSESFSVLCSGGNNVCAGARINARDGLVTCDGGDAGKEACRGDSDTEEPIEIKARCLVCENGGCGDNCKFTLTGTEDTVDCSNTVDGFYGDCDCSDSVDLTNCALRDALESRIVDLETRNDALETRIDELETGIHAKLDEILDTCSPSPAPKSTKSTKSSYSVGMQR